MKCFYHRNDLDGHCSGAIVKLNHPNCEMIGIEYNDVFPWDSIGTDEPIYMVDFSLKPDDMLRLALNRQLVWIDHHKSAIDSVKAESGQSIAGFRIIGLAGCELTWKWFYPNKQIPDPIELLGRYDVWDHKDPRVLPFQYRMRMEETDPSTEDGMILWEDLINLGSIIDIRELRAGKMSLKRHYIDDLVKDGELLLRYEDQQNAKFAKVYAFETALRTRIPGNEPGQIKYTLSGIPETIEIKAICVNKGFGNSKVFDSVYDPDRHDLMISFVRTTQGNWKVSLYSDKANVDCGSIAKQFGGGGHKGAAGFHCDNLPFEV